MGDFNNHHYSLVVRQTQNSSTNCYPAPAHHYGQGILIYITTFLTCTSLEFYISPSDIVGPTKLKELETFGTFNELFEFYKAIDEIKKKKSKKLLPDKPKSAKKSRHNFITIGSTKLCILSTSDYIWCLSGCVIHNIKPSFRFNP